MIVTVTMNASVDKAYYMDGSICNGEVMRVSQVRNSAGGKGLNVSRAVKLCGEEVLATGLAGGFNGQYLETLLDLDEVPHNFAHIQGETRSCINILDETYGSTEYLEPGCQVTEEEMKRFLTDTYLRSLEQAEVVTLSGSVPMGVPTDIYQQLIRICRKQDKKVILDTSGELLRQGLQAHPTLVKPNREEMEALYGVTIHSMEEVRVYAEKIYQTGIPYVVVSLGGDGAMLICEEGVYQGMPPKLTEVNTVGCGDSMVGAFAVALKRGYAPKEALTYAVAVASANAVSPDTGKFDPAVCREILENVTVKKL